MQPCDTLETPRLRLRPPELSDADSIFHGYAQDPEVVKYLVWRPHVAIADTRAFLEHCLQQWHAGAEAPFVIERKEDGQLIGMIAARWEDGYCANIGYVLARKYWGQGFATEAAKAVVDWAFAQPRIYRVWATCDLAHAASGKVLTKSGMQCEGILRRWALHPNISSEPRDCYCYAKVK